MKSRMYSALLGVAAICCTAMATVASAPAAFADPSASTADLCTISYPTPDDAQLAASSVVSVEPGGAGSMNLTVKTDSQSDAGYDQNFTVNWSNLDTGRSGVADTTVRVQGADTVYSIPDAVTQPGRIALVLGAHNHGLGEFDQYYTNGDCSVEYAAT